MFDWTSLGYAALVLGTISALVSGALAVRQRSRRTDTTEEQVRVEVEATKRRLDEVPEPLDVPGPLAQWQEHAAKVASHQLATNQTFTNEALRQSKTTFRMGMAAAAVGFLALLGSLAWLLLAGQDLAVLGVVSSAMCEVVAGLFFAEATATRRRTQGILERAQTEADRVVRARDALQVTQNIKDDAIREQLLADIGRWLLDGDVTEERPAPAQERP